MTKEKKTVVIEELKSKFSTCQFFYITDAGGMTVESVNKFRRMCFEKGIEYKIYKNSLIKKALQAVTPNIDYTEFNKKVLEGFSGVLFSPESGSAPAKLLKEFRSANPSTENKPLLKGASIDSSLYIGEKSLDELSKVKSRIEMIGVLAGTLQSVGAGLASALKSSGDKIAGVLKTLSEKEEAE